MLGAVTFLALGYVIASFAKTEDAANGMTSVVQFPMMFLSGTFFPIEAMPPRCRRRPAHPADLPRPTRSARSWSAARAFAPLWVCAAVLVGWLVVCFGIAARKFRWQ